MFFGDYLAGVLVISFDLFLVFWRLGRVFFWVSGVFLVLFFVKWV